MLSSERKQLTLLLKPASGLCNLRCQYCFYRDVSENRATPSRGMMTRATVERLLEEAFCNIAPRGNVTFLFQGGEPTLAGLGFFRFFLEAEDRLKPPGVTVAHAIQTNGYCLDETWVEFLAKHNFLVGLSLDGTQALHDAFRLDSTGEGTWEHTVRVLELLSRFHVETNLLCVVTGPAAKKGRQIYRNLTKLGNFPLQFIPCLDPLMEKRGERPYSLTPQGYSTFLCQVFDCWYRDWKQGHYVSIRLFDDYLRHLLRLPPSSCATSGSCGHYLVVEGDGSLYPCDFYAVDDWYLGNIHDLTLPEALASPVGEEFCKQGSRPPEDCLHCRYGYLCRGGCYRDRVDGGTNYYCSSYLRFFSYALSRLEEMAAAYDPRG